MPTAQMDALGAFSYLSGNLPVWITRLSDLTAHTTAKHAEFAEAFKKHSNTPSKPRQRRNSSVCSIHTSSASQAPHRKGGEDDGEACSFDTGDHPTLVSTRNNLIIHYDGHTQKTLEDMVRNIGTARNNLRKGKMSQLPLAAPPRRSAARALLPSLDEPTLDNSDDLLATVRSARARGPPVPQPIVATTRQSPFDLADKNLELAHSFCETAAYQFLRSGACTSELKSVNDRFNVLLKMATEEVQQLQQEKDKLAEEAENPPESTELPVSLKRPASSEGPIEVDDEQASVESIDMTTFRLGRFRR
ncbi:hypothetical protein BJX76DRAFT_327985 [Aspergillus varians]